MAGGRAFRKCLPRQHQRLERPDGDLQRHVRPAIEPDLIPSVDIVIRPGTPDETTIRASDIGIVLTKFAPASVPVDGNGMVMFEVGTAPTIAADFSTFGTIVDNCTGNLCAMVPILTLNAVPIPATVWLLSSALGLLGWIRRGVSG